MNVITVASRKGGAGKTTICAHLAAHAHALGHRTLVIDGDPQGSLALCNSLRSQALPLMTAERGIDRALALAMVDGIQWVFIDTAPTMWVVVQEAVRAATMVLIPARPGFLDLSAVRETVKCARERDKPYAVVLNACPVKRAQKEAPAVVHARTWLEKNKDSGLVGPDQPAHGFRAVAVAWRERGRGRRRLARSCRDQQALERGGKERRGGECRPRRSPAKGARRLGSHRWSRSDREIACDDLVPFIGTFGGERVFVEPDLIGGLGARLSITLHHSLRNARLETRVAGEHIDDGLALRLQRLHAAARASDRGVIPLQEMRQQAMQRAFESVELLLRKRLNLAGEIGLIDGLPATVAHQACLLRQPRIEILPVVGCRADAVLAA